MNQRIIQIGGLTKQQLLKKLGEQGVLINELGLKLFEDERFVASTHVKEIKLVEVTVQELGYKSGAKLEQIFGQACQKGLELCPLETGPYLRLQYLDQSEETTDALSGGNKAPSGSLTVASPVFSEESQVPKGFYLRKLDDQLWLRGYTSAEQHVFSSADRFVFAYRKNEW